MAALDVQGFRAYFKNTDNEMSQQQFDHKQVAVVVPMHARDYLTPDEDISLNHLQHHLSRYDRYFVLPRGIEINRPGIRIKRFGDRFFGSAAANTSLMLSRKFYESFQDYTYILVYQLDALVFSDQLAEWCAKDFDFIGAPWINCETTPWVKEPGVGNGGFSLRKVAAFLKVLKSNRYSVDPGDYWQNITRSMPVHLRTVNLPKKYIKRLRPFNGVQREVRHFSGNEDRFWARRATQYYPDFSIAPVETALKFAFEVEPRRCFEMNNHCLPFGCHAWPRYDRDFWEPYLLTNGVGSASVPSSTPPTQ